MASSDEQLRSDMSFGTTARDVGVSVSIEIKIYDKDQQYTIGNTPRNNRTEVLEDINRALDILQAQSVQRSGTPPA